MKVAGGVCHNRIALLEVISYGINNEAFLI